MGQIIINTGNIANDGTGAPLRTAFTDTNYNFTQLFAAGPVGSNITIANNTIQVNNTNGNLQLATNGIGVVVPAANFVPDVPNVRSIGLGTNRFSTVYSQYINAATGTFSGNVYVAGNLQVTGNVVTVDYSNLSVANSNITLATGAANAAQADGGGVLIPIADANFTYDYSANSWNSTIAITAPIFIGDGANLTNVIANVQANALLGNTFSNSVNYSNLTNFGLVATISATGDVSTTGNVYANNITANRVTANYLYGNGSNITNITANAIVGNVPFALVANTAYVANLAALATQAINADTALFAINANLASFANTATIAQTANAATYAVQADNANSAVVAGMAYQLAPTANLSVTGNITTGGYFIGDGGLISNIVVTTSYGNSNVASYLQNLTTNVSTTGNITGNYFIGDGSQLTGISGGANTQVQYNANGVFAGSAAFTFDQDSNTLSISNTVATTNLTAASIATTSATIYGNLSGVNANFTGNVAANNISVTDNITAAGNITGGNILTGEQVIANGEIQSGTGLFTGGYLSVNGSSDLADVNVSGNLSAVGNISANTFYIGNTPFTRTLTVGRLVTPVTVPLASNNSFNVLTANGSSNVVVYTT
jgi:hypothetical protein